MERKHWVSIWYFVAAFVAITMFQYWMEARHSETIAYSDFKKLLIEPTGLALGGTRHPLPGNG